jgi:hypothetical protein
VGFRVALYGAGHALAARGNRALFSVRKTLRGQHDDRDLWP